MNGIESVWDYPRPPHLERVTRRLRVTFAGTTIADTQNGFRVLETSHPPTFYLPPDDVRVDLIEPAAGRSLCEWKGEARYWTIVAGESRAERAAWSYPSPSPAFAAIRDHLSFYASRVDACFVDDEQVLAQDGDFYGGWITSDVQGPFKGAIGTLGW
jgi:uncharacterized protein (DUF427 family)